MRKLTHIDGRPISFDRQIVLSVEPHESGDGSLVRLGPISNPRDIHVKEDYASALHEVTESDMDRIVKDLTAKRSKDRFEVDA